MLYDLRVLKHVFDMAVTSLQYILMGIFSYYFITGMFGWFKRKEIPAEKFAPENKFAMLVAAHNEERVIGNIVRNLQALKYPKDKYDIFVIADNCNDNTAKIAAENGAKVYERFDTVKRGKGFSLEWMFKKLFEMDKKYDAICILDADNLVSTNFLLEMNKQLCLGHEVIQGYLDSKNPKDSWVAGNYSISYWISNRLFQLPRHYLGLNCALGGTGFVMSTKVLKAIGWGATCLTEDLEFSIKLVLKGMKVSWAHEAVVYDEKPLRLAQSWRQRKRWMQGHCDCAERYLKDLLVKSFKEMNFVAFDAALYLLQPFVIVANGVIAIIGAIHFLFFANPLELDLVQMVVSSVPATFVALLSLFFIFTEGKLSPKIAAYFVIFPIYGLTWIPIIIQGFFDRKKRVWVHTLHTRAMDINDLKKLEKVS